MEGTPTNHCSSERRFLPSPVAGIPFLFHLADHCVGAEQNQNGHPAGFAKFTIGNTGTLFINHKQAGIAGSFDNNIRTMDKAVDYAEQL